MFTTNFLWVFYFQQIGELPNFFQNQSGGMIFSKMTPNFTVLEGIFETQFQIRFFFGPSNFSRDFFRKFDGNFSIFGELIFLVRFIFKAILL